MTIHYLGISRALESGFIKLFSYPQTAGYGAANKITTFFSGLTQGPKLAREKNQLEQRVLGLEQEIVRLNQILNYKLVS